MGGLFGYIFLLRGCLRGCRGQGKKEVIQTGKEPPGNSRGLASLEEGAGGGIPPLIPGDVHDRSFTVGIPTKLLFL